ncbi:hypothetical protein ACRHK7_00380 [Weissella tructae]|uniref:hypothetical protein n=1 Tax=Weissella tructae TaxID=887702 RepID=UPI003D9054B4
MIKVMKFLSSIPWLTFVLGFNVQTLISSIKDNDPLLVIMMFTALVVLLLLTIAMNVMLQPKRYTIEEFLLATREEKSDDNN